MHYTAQLTRRLKEEFPGRAFVFSDAPGLVVTIAPDCPDVGAIEIYDEDDELTVKIGRFTHTHFSPYNYTGFSDDELIVELVEGTISFLRDIFSDNIVMWGSHKSSGGTFQVGATPNVPVEPRGPLYVWSGPYHDV